MTGSDVMTHLLEGVTRQLKACFAEISDEELDFAWRPEAMTARQMAVHLTEVYMAVLAKAAGTEFEWGSYQPPSMESEALLSEMWAKRDAAIQAFPVKDDPAAVEVLSDYVIGHDYYHVGQLVIARLSAGKGFDAYAIYR
jgi:uncharacterized damage-inducible protein DinB